MKLFLLFACATNAASPDSLATLDTANQNLASTKGNFQQVEITGKLPSGIMVHNNDPSKMH